MSVPHFSDKLSGREITGPRDWVSYMQEKNRFSHFQVPEIFIFTWQKSFFKWIKSRYAHQACSDFIGDVLLLDGRRSHEAGGVPIVPKIGVAGNFGIGAPSAVLLMESLIALGVKKFIGLGTAGGLMDLSELDKREKSRSLQVGDTILVDKAYRDEGTSFHYLPKGASACPDREMFNWLESLMKEKAHPYRTGPLWTTDAFFRETAQEVEYYRKRGVLAVDMEASALFACAEMRGVSMASLFVLSDILTTEGWAPDFHHKGILRTLGTLFEMVGGIS